MKKFKLSNPFKGFTKFEIVLWVLSIVIVGVSFAFLPEHDYLKLAASLIGVAMLIFIAKGRVIGQFMTIIFAVLYGVVSFFSKYYGEMITYLGMTAPIALITVITWLKHPFKDTPEVTVGTMNLKQALIMLAVSVAVTVAMYFVLRAFKTNQLIFSTISVFTSFVAAYLLVKRNPFYAVAFAANDIVLIVLWVLAAIEDISCLPMIICFSVFLVNDIYGFINWRRMLKRQTKETENDENKKSGAN